MAGSVVVGKKVCSCMCWDRVDGAGNESPDTHTDTFPRSRPLEFDSVVCSVYLRSHVSAVKEETTEFAEMKLH